MFSNFHFLLIFYYFQVYPLIREDAADLEAAQNQLLEQVTGEDSELEKLAGKGDMQELTQYVTSVSTSLNALKNIDSVDNKTVPDAEKTDLQAARTEVSNSIYLTLSFIWLVFGKGPLNTN